MGRDLILFTSEDLQKGSEIFFHLLKNKIVPRVDTLAYEYIDNPDIRQIVNTLAAEAGLKVFDTMENIHLVSNAYGSMFSNSYTQMKDKYKGLKRKKYFYLANIIICVFISMVDKEKNIRIRWEEEGLTYYKLEDEVTKTLESWKKRFDQGEAFSDEWGIALEEIYDLWTNDFSTYKTSQTGDIEVQRTTNNKFSFIHEAFKPLRDQGLIIDNQNELKIIPKIELYERLENLYHKQERYDEIMSLIKEGELGDA